MEYEIEDGLKAILAWWDDAGVDVPDVPEAPKRRTVTARAKTSGRTPVQSSAQKPSNTSQAPSRASAQASALVTPDAKLASLSARTEALVKDIKTLDALKTAMRAFDAGPLSDGARQCVFSRGNSDAKIMVIGEAPGLEEDMQGKPFVGPSGQLLDKMLGAIGLTEEDVYFTNVVNWRLPKNRNPKSEEIEFCRPLFMRHIELINPDILVLVGGQSMTALTGLEGIMKLRGQWQTVTVKSGDTLKDIPAMPLYHPAFLLRQPALKKDAWRDLLSLKLKIDERSGKD